ncbi:MAG: TaqI-like C-terminal specificity domain-containing protein [Hymenobacter sp.]
MSSAGSTRPAHCRRRPLGRNHQAFFGGPRCEALPPAPPNESYLLLLPSGWTRKQLGWQRNAKGTYAVAPSRPNCPTPWDALLAHYPAVANYLLPFEKAATSRTDQGNYWWELRSCDYYDEFEKPKIIVTTFATSAYTYDRHGLYGNDKTTIIPTDDLFLLGVLNSSATDFYLSPLGKKLKDAFFEYKPKYLSQLPIPTATAAQRAEVGALVETILAARAADATADTAAAEAAVDALVAALYGLTPAEAAHLARPTAAT